MAGLVTLALCVGMVAGCGQDGRSSGAEKAPPLYLRAADIKDGAPKYFPEQGQCPVCPTSELREKIYVDVDGKRIYFDSEECRKKFKQNRSKYLQKLDKRKKEASGGEK